MTNDDRHELVGRLARHRGSSARQTEASIWETVALIRRFAAAKGHRSNAHSDDDLFARVLMEAYNLTLVSKLPRLMPRGERRREILGLVERLKTIHRKARLPKAPIHISRESVADLQLLDTYEDGKRHLSPAVHVALSAADLLSGHLVKEAYIVHLSSAGDAEGLAAGLLRAVAHLDASRFYGADPGGRDPNRLKREAVSAAMGLLEEVGVKPTTSPGGKWAEVSQHLWQLAGLPDTKPNDVESFDKEMGAQLKIAEGIGPEISAPRQRP